MKSHHTLMSVLLLILVSCTGSLDETPSSIPSSTQSDPVSVVTPTATADPALHRPPKPRYYCADNPVKRKDSSEPPETFLYLPFQDKLSGEIWTAQMDHDQPNYQQNGVMSSLGEIMIPQLDGPGLRGGTEVYDNSSNQWYSKEVLYSSLKRLGYYIFAYQSPSFETYHYYDGHDGHDFAVSGNALAAGDGRIVFVGNDNDSLGRIIEIYHPQGYLTRYAHLASFNENLNIGSKVKAGEKIGVIGGSAVINGEIVDDHWGTHLHFVVFRWDGSTWKIVDPFAWDPWAGPNEESRNEKQKEDPLVNCNGEVSHNLWVGGWPRTFEAEQSIIVNITHGQYLGGWLGEVPEITTTPSGQIAYMTNGEIHIYDLGTKTDLPITNTGNNRLPAWSHDGRYLLYIHGPRHSSSLNVVDNSWNDVASFPARSGQWVSNSYEIIWINQAHDAFYHSELDGSNPRRIYEDIPFPDPSHEVWDDFSLSPSNDIVVSLRFVDDYGGYLRMLARGLESYYETYLGPTYKGAFPGHCMFSLDQSRINGEWSYMIDSTCMGWAPGAKHIFVPKPNERYLEVFGGEPSWSFDEKFLVFRFMEFSDEHPGPAYGGLAYIDLRTDEVTKFVFDPDAQQPTWRP
jgi:murein DD-endopeptidase MepM/ murein hydrolase activator NlpD